MRELASLLSVISTIALAVFFRDESKETVENKAEQEQPLASAEVVLAE
jgi:hypothetical protein